MKRHVILILFFMCALASYGQNEVASDSIRFSTENYKQFGDFIVDMSLFQPPKLPKSGLDLLPPSPATDYNYLFQLDPKWTFSKWNAPYVSYNFYGNFSSYPQNLQAGSFKLTDNIRLNTYGQYTLDGRKLPNTNPNPWNRDSFVGGMELKINKNFGIRVEVRQGYNPLYPY